MRIPDDRRQKSIVINGKGLAILDKVYHCELKADTLLSNLSQTEMTELNRLLDKIRDCDW